MRCSQKQLWRKTAKRPSINDVGNWEGEGVKNWSKLPTDSTKKLPTWGRGLSKTRKIADFAELNKTEKAFSP
jgi:hypothetical protein